MHQRRGRQTLIVQAAVDAVVVSITDGDPAAN